MNELENICQQMEELAQAGRFGAIRPLTEHIEPADIAWMLSQLDQRQAILAFRVLHKETAAAVFVELDPDAQMALISGFSDEELKNVMDGLFLDDAADLIDEMPANVVKRLLKQTTPEKRAAINRLLQYPKDSAGSMMTPEYVDLKADITVTAAFERIRKVGPRRETIYTCYVTDSARKLQGVVTVKDLLLAAPDALIGDVMERDVVYFNTLDDRELVAQGFDKYDFLAFPIVDGEGRLVGIVTVDDAMDVLQEENTEDIEKMAAIVPSDRPYLQTDAFTVFRRRIPWLLVLMVSATFTGQIITRFENALAAQAVLTAFIPMLMDTAGNSGSQASVTVIRGLSLQELRFADLPRVLWKEARVSLLCGAALAVVGFLKLMLIDNLLLRSHISLMVAAVVCVTLCCTVFLAKLVGCLLPMLADRAGLDPAVMASPFITTIVDALSLLIYFAAASAILKL